MKKNFNFGLGINLSKAETEDYAEFEGIASTPDLDLQGEILDQNGLDLTPILQGKGIVNDDHGNNYPVKSHSRLGVIDDAKLTPEGLWLKGKIWKNHPASTSYINELKYKPGMVQLSVEGAIVERDRIKKNRVKRARIHGVALTHNPVNTRTYAQLVKSLFSGESQEFVENKQFEEYVEIEKSKLEEIKESLKELQLLKSKQNQELKEFILEKAKNNESFRDQVFNKLKPIFEKKNLNKGGKGSGIKGHKTVRTLDNQEERIDKIYGSIKQLRQIGKDVPYTERKEQERKEKLDKKYEEKQIDITPEEGRQYINKFIESSKEPSKIKDLIDKLRNKVGNDATLAKYIKNLTEAVKKSLAPGGPQYTGTPDSREGGAVFMTESLESDKEKKKTKKKFEHNDGSKM